MKQGLKSTISFIDQNDYARIHEASLKILRETGVVFQNDDAIEIFKKNGVKTEGRTVYITEDLVNKALKAQQRTYVLNGKNPAHDVVVGKDVLVQPNAGPVYVQDLDHGRRFATIEDYANFMKLAQASDVVNMVGPHVVNPSDVPNEFKHLYMGYEAVKNSDKPVLGWGGMNKKTVKEFLDLIEISMGYAPETSGKQFANVSVNPLSPLSWDYNTCHIMMEYSRRGQGLYMLPCIMAGLTGPMRPMGTIVLQNTEILSGIVFSYLVNPQTPVVYSPSSSIGYMQKGTYISGNPDMMLVNSPLLAMGHEMYNMPTRCMVGMCDSKVVDAQAGLETMQNVMMGVFTGADIILECLGVLDSIMTVSYEKHIIDEEIIKRVLFIRDGIDTSDDAMSVELIQDVGPGGNYLMEDDTFDYCHEPFQNTVSYCDGYAEWVADGSLDIAQRANKIFKERLAKAPETFLTPDIDKDVKAYMNKCMGI